MSDKKRLHPSILADIITIRAAGWTTHYFLFWLGCAEEQLCIGGQGLKIDWVYPPGLWFAEWKEKVLRLAIKKLETNQSVVGDIAEKLGITSVEAERHADVVQETQQP